MSLKTKIILVDDHALVRAGFRLFLAGNPAVEIIGEAERGEQAIQLFLEGQADMLIMDISMPGIGGLEAMRRILHHDPQALVLVYSVHHEQVYVQRALDAGAKGYITKTSAPELLLEAIQTIRRGQVYVEKGLLKHAQPTSGLHYQSVIGEFSPREFDVFIQLARGKSVVNIAEHMHLSYKTVANYATQVRKKLHVENDIELMRIAEHTGGLPHG